MSADAWLQRIWYGPAWRALPLWPLAWLYGAVLAGRRLACRVGLLRPVSIDVPVIVVGNVTVGGTGKTPVAAWLARRLSQRGLKVGVVLRGYGGSHRGAARIVGLSDNPTVVGDEALLHARRGVHVVVIGADRAAAAALAVTHGAQVVVADDGLQHVRLGRDYEIAVIDGARGLGNGWLLPAGPLRERASRLESVHAVIATHKTNDAADADVPVATRKPLRLSARLVLGDAVNLVTSERKPLAHFVGSADLHAVAAVGHPPAFFAALERAGLDFVSHALPDHSALDPAALPFASDATVLMTEKDAVKCTAFGQPDWWWVDLEVGVDRADAELLLASILERVGLTGAGVPLG
jgi:tetraacyldisaccharide 4'-kinase